MVATGWSSSGETRLFQRNLKIGEGGGLLEGKRRTHQLRGFGGGREQWMGIAFSNGSGKEEDEDKK